MGDADDVFYDAAHKRVYISGGEGLIDIFAESGVDTRKKDTIFEPRASGIYHFGAISTPFAT